MSKVFRDLPEHYECSKTIDMKNNKGELILLNVLSVLAFIPFIFGLAIMEASFTTKPLGVLLFFLACILNIIVHELIHAFFFKRKNKLKVKFKFHGFAASASVPGVYFQKRHYAVVSLAPFVIISIILLPFLFILSGSWFYFFYFLFAIHFSGCVGDFYVSYQLFKVPKNTLIEDYGIGMRFYVRVNEELDENIMDK